MLPLTNVGRTLDVLGSLPQGIDSFNKLTGPAPSSALPDIIKSGLSPKVGPSASFTDIMNGYRAAYSQPANPDSPSFKMFMQEEYAPLGINKWTHEQRNQFINSFPHPYETSEINGPTDLVGMKVNEYATGLPPLKYYEEVERAAEAYDQDPSSKNKVQLQLKLAAFNHRKNEAANKKIISEVEQANPYDLAIDDVAAATSQGPLDTAQQPFLEGALGIARMTERIYSTFQGKQAAKDVLYRQQLDRAIRNRQYEQDLGPLSGVAGFAEDATTAASEMLPSLAVGGAAGVGLKAAGWGARGIGVGASLASQPVLGFQVWAQSYEQARQQGWSDKSALMYGGAMAAVETAVEFFGGKLVSKFGFKTAERQLFDLFDNWGTIPVESLGKLAKTRMAQAAIGEGAEEAITEGIQKLVDHFSGMEPYEITSPAELGEAIVKTLGDVGYAFMLGGTVGAGMAGPTTLAESYAWAQRAQQIQANARRWAEKVAAGQSVDQGDQRYTFDHVRDIMAGVSREFEGAQTAFFNQEDGIAWLQQQDPLIQEGAEAAVRAGVSQSEYANLVSNLRPTTAAEIDHIIGLASAHKKAELINPTERQAEAPLPEHRLAELNARPETDQVSQEAEQYVQGWESNLTPKEAQFVYDKQLNEDEWKATVQHRETGVASDPLVEEGEQETPDGPVAVAEGKYEPDKTEVDAEPTDRLHDQAKQVIEEVPNATVEDVAQKLDVDEQRAEALVSDVMQDEPVVEVDDSPDAVLQFIKDNDDPSRSPREVAEELSDTYAPDVGQRSADDIQVVIEQIRAESKPKQLPYKAEQAQQWLRNAANRNNEPDVASEAAWIRKGFDESNYAPYLKATGKTLEQALAEIHGVEAPPVAKPKKGLDEREVQVGGQKFKIFKQDGVWYSRDHKTGDVVDGRQGDQSPLWLGDDVAQAKKAIGEWQKAGKLPGGKQASEPESLSPTAGWKLHLTTKDPEAVSAKLKDMGLRHKVGRNSDQQGKDVTVYVGSRDDANAAADRIAKELGGLLDPPAGEVLQDDIELASNVMGRFDAAGDKAFHQYGRAGKPWLAEHMDPYNPVDPAVADAAAEEALREKYGDFYTGTQAAPKPTQSPKTPAKPPALPKKPKKEPPPIVPPERKPTAAQQKAYQKLLDQADKLKNPDAESRQAAQEALSRARKEAEASNPGASKERLDELVVPLAVNIAKSNRSRKRPGYLPSLGTRSVQTADPVPADKEAQYVQDLLAKAFPDAKFDFKVKRAGKKLIIETSDGRQVEVRLMRGGIKVSKEAKIRALKDRGLSQKEAEALDVIVYGRIDTQSNIDASGIPVIELTMSGGRTDNLGNKTKWVMMEHTLRHEMLHFFYYTGLITQEDIEALRPMLPKGFSDTEALSYAAEYIDEGLMAKISDAFFEIMDALGVSFLLGKERLTKAKLRKIALGSTISSRLSEQAQNRSKAVKQATLDGGTRVFHPETNDFSLSGEFWLQDGAAQYADGDIGDMNHEAIAMDYAQRLIIDQFAGATTAADDYVDWDQFESDVAKYMEDEGFEETPEKSLFDIWVDESDIDPELLAIAQGFGDSREWAARTQGWVRLAGNDAEVYGLTKSRLKEIADGLADAHPDEDLDKETFNIYDYKTRQTYWEVPYAVIEAGDMSALRDSRIQGESNLSASPKKDNQERTVIRYTHRDGRGLMNNQSLDRSKLTDDEEFELVDLLDFGLRQPPHGTVGTFYFTPEGEKKHARLIKLLKKASKTGVVRKTKKVPEVTWESSDGQVASNFSVSVRPTTLKLKSWAAINRLKSPNDVVTEAYLRKQGVSPNELFWTGLEDALQLSGGRMTKGQVEGILSRSNFKVDDIEEREEVTSGREVMLGRIGIRTSFGQGLPVGGEESFYPEWSKEPGLIFKTFRSAELARKEMPEMLDRWRAASIDWNEGDDPVSRMENRMEIARKLLKDLEYVAYPMYLGQKLDHYHVDKNGVIRSSKDGEWETHGSIFDSDNAGHRVQLYDKLRRVADEISRNSGWNTVRPAAWQSYTIGSALENAEGIEVTDYRNLLVEWNGYIPSAVHAPGRSGLVRWRSAQQQSHWDGVASGTNIIASARLTEMYHPELGKTLIVEEIQSDLIQSIHEYKSSIDTLKALVAGELAEEDSHAYHEIEFQAINKWQNAVTDLVSVGVATRGMQDDRASLARDRFLETKDAQHLMFKEIEDIQVPLESKYKEMMVKRVTQEAAAGDYDTISWPSGEWHHQMYYYSRDPRRNSHVRVKSVAEINGYYMVAISQKQWTTDFGNHMFKEAPYLEHYGLTKKGIRALLGPMLGAQAIDMIEKGTKSEVEIPEKSYSDINVKATQFTGIDTEFVPAYDNPGLVTAYRDVMPMVFSNVMKKAKVKVEELAAPLHDRTTESKFKLKYIRLNDAVREQAPEYSLFSISIKDKLASAVNVPLGKLKSNDFLNFLTDQFASGGNRPQVLIDAAAEEVGRSSDTIVKAAGAARKLEQAIANDPNHTRDQYLQELNQLQMTNPTSTEWTRLSAKFTPEVAEATKKLRDIVDSLSEEVWELMKDINTRVNKAVFKYSPSMLKTISMRIAKAGNGAQVYLTTSYQNFQPPTRYERMYRLLGAVGLSPTGHPFRDKQLNNEQLKVKFIQTLSRVKWPDPGPWTGNPADPKYKKNPQKYAKDLANWKKAKKRAGKLKFEKFANMSATKKLEAIDNLFAYLLNKDTLDFGDRGRAPTGFSNITKKRKLDDRLEEDRLIQELYGKIENPLENQVITIDALSSLVAELNIIKFIQTEGVAQGWVARKPEDYERGKNPRYVNLAPLHNDNLPSTKALEGYVADKWIAKAIHDMFSQKTDSGLLGAYMDLVQLTKRNKTIWGGPRSIVRNDFANYVISMLNGVPLLHMGAKFISYGREAYKIGRHGLESVPQDRQDLWNEAIRHGLGEDVTIAEQNAIKRRGMGMAENLSGPNQSLKRGLDKHLPYDVLRRTSQLLRNLYQLADTKHKVMQYEIQRPLFVKAALHDAGVNVGQYANDAAMLAAVRTSHPKLYESACRACAKEVRQTTPTYSLAPKVVQTISKRLPIGPFAIFSMEVLRSTAKRMEIMSSQLKSTNPHVQQLGRMKLQGIFNYIVFVQVGTWLLKQLAGVSDEEDEANRKRMPFWMRNSRIMYLPWAGQPGDRYFVDLGFTDPMNIFYSGLLGTLREGPVEGVKEIFEPVTSEDLVFNAIISLARNADENRRPIYDEGVTRDRQAIQIFNFLRKKLQPGMADWMPKLIPGVNGGEYDPKTEAASFFGLRPYQVNRIDSDRFRTQEFYRRLMSTNSVVLAELRRKNFNPDRVRAIYRSAARKRRQIADEWREYMESSLYLGASDPVGDAVAFLEKSKDTINDVYYGRPIHYLPANETLDKLRGMDRGYERVALIKDLYNEARYGATE